jgi:hypothetical protein
VIVVTGFVIMTATLVVLLARRSAALDSRRMVMHKPMRSVP